MPHKDLAAGRWQNMPLTEQLANIASEVSRVHYWKTHHDPEKLRAASARARELISLTVRTNHLASRQREISQLESYFETALSDPREALKDLEQELLPYALLVRHNS